MIDLQEIEDEINILEHGKTSYNSLQKLSILYHVRDKLSEQEKPKFTLENAQYSFADEASEFMGAISGKPVELVFDLLDSHFDCVKVLYPKEYKKVLDSIRAL